MIKLLILDVDGVMTDGIKYYDREGTVKLKTFCDKDWTAIKRFRAIGVNVVFLTGDPYNISILENRNLHVIANRGSGFHSDKVNYLDDIFDIGIMKKVRYPICMLDSPRIVKQTAKVLPVKGGENVVMTLFDTLEIDGLLPCFSYDKVIDKIYELDLKEKF